MSARIIRAHGGGGSRTRQLIREVILKRLDNPLLRGFDDAVCLAGLGGDVVFTTDSYVVTPLFFPGGDIGRLAVCGTVNDLAMQGGDPRYLSLGLIVEEGLALADLDRVLASVAVAAAEAGVTVVTGDTKVIGRRAEEASGLYINTSGIGVRRANIDVHVSNARPGDVVIVSGTVGDHGVAVMSCREGLQFTGELASDVAPLGDLMARVLATDPTVRCLRDPTRGGLAAALCDIAEAAGVCVRLWETAVPIRDPVRGACRLLGLDPLNVANEGKAVIVCAAPQRDRVLATLHAHPLGRHAVVVGRIDADSAGLVILETAIGGERVVDLPSGEDLPRIC